MKQLIKRILVRIVFLTPPWLIPDSIAEKIVGSHIDDLIADWGKNGFSLARDEAAE